MGINVEKQIASFGEALSSIMNAKKISVTKLCQMMNIKSQTTVSRILKDESSYGKTREFHDALIRNDPLETNEYDRQLLSEALEVNKIGKDMYRAKKEMLYFVNKKIDIRQFVLSGSSASAGPGVKTFADLTETYKKYSEIRICVVNCIFDGVIKSLADILTVCGEKLEIEQYIQTETGLFNEVHQFISLLPVINIKNYFCYKSQSASLIDEQPDPFKNFIYALKKTESGEAETDIVSINDDYTFSILPNLAGPAAYDFYSGFFNRMRARYYPIKKSPEPKPPLLSLVEITSHFLSLEETWQQMIIKPDFGFYAVSADKLARVTDDETRECEYGKRLAEIHDKRNKNYCKNGRKHTGIYTRHGIESFIKTGRLSDHLPIFRPFTGDEAREVIRDIIKISDSTPLNQIYILKNDIIHNQYQYVLLNSNIMMFSDNRTDYGYLNYEYIINSQRMIKVFYEFIVNDLIPNHCFTFEESMEILRGLAE